MLLASASLRIGTAPTQFGYSKFNTLNHRERKEKGSRTPLDWGGVFLKKRSEANARSILLLPNL